jgi:hypothetical protein
MYIKLPDYIIQAVINGIKEEVMSRVADDPKKSFEQHVTETIKDNDSICEQFIQNVITEWNRQRKQCMDDLKKSKEA